jgi:hypothetical protein
MDHYHEFLGPRMVRPSEILVTRAVEHRGLEAASKQA